MSDESIEKGIEKMMEKARVSLAIRDAKEYQDFERLAEMIEQGNEALLASPDALQVAAQALRGEFKQKRGNSGKEKKRKAERDNFALMLINFYQGYGYEPIWSHDNPGICGMASSEIMDEGYKPMEPEAIYRHVWSNRASLGWSDEDDRIYFQMGERAAANDKHSQDE